MDQAEVLGCEREREGNRRRLGVEERVALVADHGRAGGARGEDVVGERAIDAVALGEDESFGNGAVETEDERVDGELHDRAAAEWPEVEDAAGQAFEDRAARRSRSAVIATDHDRQLARAREADAARDRRVEHARAARAYVGRERADRVRQDGAHLDGDGARPQPGDDPIRSAIQRRDGVVVGDHRDDDVRPGARPRPALPPRPRPADPLRELRRALARSGCRRRPRRPAPASRSAIAEPMPAGAQDRDRRFRHVVGRLSTDSRRTARRTGSG